MSTSFVLYQIFVDSNNWEEDIDLINVFLLFDLLSEKAFDERTKSKEQRLVPANVMSIYFYRIPTSV